MLTYKIDVNKKCLRFFQYKSRNRYKNAKIEWFTIYQSNVTYFRSFNVLHKSLEGKILYQGLTKDNEISLKPINCLKSKFSYI